MTLAGGDAPSAVSEGDDGSDAHRDGDNVTMKAGAERGLNPVPTARESRNRLRRAPSATPSEPEPFGWNLSDD